MQETDLISRQPPQTRTRRRTRVYAARVQRRLQPLLQLLMSTPTKVIGTLVCLFLVARSVNLSAAVSVLAHTNQNLLLTGFILTLPAVGAAMVEWSAFMPCSDRRCFARLLRVYLKALAPAHVVPTGAAGDAVRILGVHEICSWQRAITASLGARISSSVVILTWALVAACTHYGVFGPWMVAITGGALALMLAGCACTLLSPRLLATVVRLVKRLNWRLAFQLASLMQTVRALRHQKRRMATSLTGSLTGWGLQFLSLWLFARATGAAIDFQLLPLAVLLSQFACAVPFALNGMGIREGIWVALLTKAGMSSGHSAAIALLADLQMIPVIVFSALLWLIPEHPSSTTGRS